MRWRVIEFLRKHHITYVESGKNVAKGNVNIRCPFCGDNDPSEHMGINLETGAWGCWRDANHRGKNPAFLVGRILGIPMADAMRLLGLHQQPNPDELQYVLNLLQGQAKPALAKPQTLNLLPEFRGITVNQPGTLYFNYLVRRGFKREHVRDFCRYYNIRYCNEGFWRKRVIVPITKDEKLVSWTARSIIPDEELRYISLSHKPESKHSWDGVIAVENIKNTLFNYDNVKEGGKRLYVCEGPFDALKVDYYGKNYGIRATALYGVSMSEEQEECIIELAKNFDETFLLLDVNMPHVALDLCKQLSVINARLATLPGNVKDPGDLNCEVIRVVL